MNRSRKTIPPANHLVRICVTGGIACGKNLVGSILAEQGVAVIDADQVCHQLMQSGGKLFQRIVTAWGQDLVGADGEINRGLLGRQVFADADQLMALNRLVHPAVIRAIEAWIKAQASGAVVAALVPLVYEAGWEHAWDGIICVAAPLPVQIERLQQRGLTEAEARARVSSQWPVEEKMRRANYVVFNGGTRTCARQQTVRILEDIAHGSRLPG